MLIPRGGVHGVKKGGLISSILISIFPKPSVHLRPASGVGSSPLAGAIGFKLARPYPSVFLD